MTLKTSLFCIFLFAFVTIGLQAREPTDQPNVIFIMADDLGYGYLGCYGQKVIQTPVLDRMAEEGMRFRNYYAGCTVCASSRSVLMTGQH
ncbi:MAG: sulfatase-like hydrolase/transferase, partial [Planctomycetota bacterium]|nr:sulfatase-like hydrolase/transferase [Planctomycetota bacterium]